MKDYVEKLIGVMFADKFAKWAFGEDFDDKDYMKLHEKWHKLHGEKLTFSCTEEVTYSINKMVDLWIEENFKD